MKAIKRKVLVLFSPSNDSRPDMVLSEAEAEAKGILFDQERVQKLEETIDQCAQVVLVINGGHVSARHAYSLRYAVEQATETEPTEIRVFARTEGEETHPSLRELEREFRENPAVKWQGFVDEILFDAAVSQYARITKSALSKVYRAKSMKAQKQGKWAEAIEFRKNAIGLDTEGGVNKLTASDHIFIGMRHIDLKEFSAAEDEISKGLSLAQEAKAVDLVIGGYEQLATVYLQSGNAPRAEAPCLEAIRLQEAECKPPSQILYRLLGQIYKDQKQLDKAEYAWKKSLELSKSGPSSGIKRISVLLFQLMFEQKRYEDALKYQKIVVECQRQEDSPHWLGICLLGLTGLYGVTKQVSEGKEALAEARLIFRDLNDRELLRKCRRLKIYLHVQTFSQKSEKYRVHLLVLLFLLFAVELFLRRR